MTNRLMEALFFVAMGLRPTAKAADVVMTITGTVQYGFDISGVFGPANTDLTGQPFTLVYTFDDTKGTQSTDACEDGRAASWITSTPASNPGTALLTINGRTFPFGGGRWGESSIDSGAALISGFACPNFEAPPGLAQYTVLVTYLNDGYYGSTEIGGGGAGNGVAPAVGTVLTTNPSWEGSFTNTNLYPPGYYTIHLSIDLSFLPPGSNQYQPVANARAELTPTSITVSGPLAPCDLCTKIASQSHSGDGQTESLRLCHMLLGALKELGDYRTSFLSKFDFINLFPTVYYEVTQLEMQRLAAGGTFSHPIAHMQQMLAFFDAYKFNRDIWNSGGIAEPHWRAAFVAATSANISPTLTLLDLERVVDAGITAHVEYDLPRALRDSFKNTFELNLTPDDLRPDFIASNQTLRDSMAISAADIQNAVSGPSWLFPSIQEMLDYAAGITDGVISKRVLAWDEASGDFLPPEIDGTPLVPQPAINHGLLEMTGTMNCVAAQ